MRFFLFLFCSVLIFGQSPKVSSGTLVEYPKFKSKYIGERTVRVWLPEGYSKEQKYQVLYANDGQMLWDANVTWNKQEWQIDERVSQLLTQKKIRQTIVVAIDNAGKDRHAEYFPQKPFESLTPKIQDSLYSVYRSKDQVLFSTKVYSDKYLHFLVEELKPFIDQTYSTRPETKSTTIMGSSMGGLISMYAICEYPEVFGNAICMSTHWPGVFSADHNPIPSSFQNYLRTHLPNPKRHKIYFDFGTATLDALYEPFQQGVDRIMKEKRFRKRHWQTLKFEGEDHSEKAWSKRLEIPLIFVLK